MRTTYRHPKRDSAGPGAWFITIGTYYGRHLFGQVVDGRMRLNAFGAIARDGWSDQPLHFPHFAPDAYVVMPNHFHAVLRLVGPDIRLTDRCCRIERFGKPVPGSVATIIRTFKAAVTRAIRERTGQNVRVWQSRFHDRRLPDEHSIKVARRYIERNPSKWEERQAYPRVGIPRIRVPILADT